MFQDVYPTSLIDYEDEEYISMKYTSDIVDTFIDMKQITESYGVQLLNNKTADSLLQFIISNCYLLDETDMLDIDDEMNDKDNLDEYY